MALGLLLAEFQKAVLPVMAGLITFMKPHELNNLLSMVRKLFSNIGAFAQQEDPAER